MKPDRWKKVDALFAAALEKDSAERSAFLDAACADDPALRREVESLLAIDGEAEGFLEQPSPVPETLARRAEAGRSPVAAGDHIGPYRLERELGSGGMGVVYLAERADDAYRGRVAIKLLHAGPHSTSLVRRFHSERQILASLDHPSIARLLDAGATADGYPYLVMEHIDGQPIDEYCDARRLGVGDRLRLCRQVCAAVHYAHQNLVVHRDIKPSNILVTADGTPRLLDFGIAKLLDPSGFPLTVEATTDDSRPMTPLFASPEQVRGEAITTASDVYSLGLLLYLLLTGRMPYQLQGASAREIERQLSERDPPRPSSVVLAPCRAADSTPENLSQRRGVRPQQLRRQLAGDLDKIVSVALRPDPARRYGAVEQLSEDLRRHLDGLPVLARQDALGYQLATFLRRHRMAVGVVGLILVLIVAFAVSMARQATQIGHQRDRAELERARAERVSGFLVDLFTGIDPWIAKGGDVTARQVLEQGAEKIERDLADQPEVRASLQNAIGSVYLHLGLYDKAAPLLEDALATREDLLGADHLDVADTLNHLGNLYRRRGKYDASQQLHQRALAILEASRGPDDPDVAEALRFLSGVYRDQGQYSPAEELGLRAVTGYRAALGPDHPEVSASLASLAGTYARQGRTAEAEELLEQALTINEEVYADDHPSIAGLRYNLGHLRLARGALAEAEELLESAVRSWQAVFGDTHPNVGSGLLVLAGVADARGQPAVAEERLRRALDVLERAVGDRHDWVAKGLHELGELLARQDRVSEAEPLLERSLAIRRQVLATDHPDIGESLFHFAQLRRRQGRPADAASYCERLWPIWEAHPQHPGLTDTPQSCAAIFRAAGQARRAEALENRAAQLAAGEAAPSSN